MRKVVRKPLGVNVLDITEYSAFILAFCLNVCIKKIYIFYLNSNQSIGILMVFLKSIYLKQNVISVLTLLNR